MHQAHISPVLKQKTLKFIAKKKNTKQENQAEPQVLTHSIFLHFNTLSLKSAVSHLTLYPPILMEIFESFMAISLHGCVLVMYL